MKRTFNFILTLLGCIGIGVKPQSATAQNALRKHVSVAKKSIKTAKLMQQAY